MDAVVGWPTSMASKYVFTDKCRIKYHNRPSYIIYPLVQGYMQDQIFATHKFG